MPENLEALTAEAAALDGELLQAGEGPEPKAEPEPEPVDPAAEWAAVLGLAVGILGRALPFVPKIYDEPAQAAIAAAIVPVAEKYGWSVAGAFGRFGPEIGLAVVVGPLVMDTWAAWAAWKAEREAAEVASRASRAAPATVAEDAGPGPDPLRRAGE